MDLPIILGGIILGLIWFLVDLERKQQRRQGRTPMAAVPTSSPTEVGPGVRFTIPTLFGLPQAVPPLQPLSTQFPDTRSMDERVSARTMLQTWRSSIVGLVKLAQSNVAHARQCLEMADFGAAVEAATTSVENVSRALLHCYGEKPELGSGQEEALKLLARRFTGSEKTDVQKTIEEIAQLQRNKAVYYSLSKPDPDCTDNYAKARTVESILDEATTVVTRFCQIIREHFATEIPELSEACPKCHAANVSVMAFDETAVRYACSQCGHGWNEPRS